MNDLARTFGLSSTHIITNPFNRPVHQQLMEPLSQLIRRARAEGFELELASGFRDFSRQLEIWNAKVEGHRPVLDDDGKKLNIRALADPDKVVAILRWSALPGASRHHWGTDIDVFDAASVAQGYQVQLTYEETCAGGIFADFHRWLDRELTQPDCLFFRPYTTTVGGVAPEPWHLSYAPVAEQFQANLTLESLREVIRNSPMLLKETVLAMLPEIFQRYVWVPWNLYPHDKYASLLPRP